VTEVDYRLELLKLTYTHGRDAAEAVRRAKELEEYLKTRSKPVDKVVSADLGKAKPKRSSFYQKAQSAGQA
jgi:hypothetical protein